MGSAEERRGMVVAAAAGAVGAGVALAAWAAVRSAREQGGAKPAEEEEVSAGEDLMREHGVLRRILLIYDEAVARIDRRAPLPLDVIAQAAGLVRRFVEDYHEDMEERHVFPRFEKAGTMVDLVRVLREQHDAGRRVTDTILARTAAGAADEVLAGALRAFTRMYRPHAAREDTVLFPAMHQIMTARAYAELGDAFEDEEHARFGQHGFERAVDEVALLEERLGIHELARFTPR